MTGNIVIGTDRLAAFNACRRRHDDRFPVGDADDADVQEAANDESEEEHGYVDKRRGEHPLNLPYRRQALKLARYSRARLLTFCWIGISLRIDREKLPVFFGERFWASLMVADYVRRFACRDWFRLNPDCGQSRRRSGRFAVATA